MRENTFKNKYGSWAIIAGAAEGLGEAYSLELARKNINLIMVDNQSNVLSNLSNKIEKEFGIKTIQIHQDLQKPEAVKTIMEVIIKKDCRLLIYNAAYSTIKPFINCTPEELDCFIDVNTRTQLKLVHQFTQHLTLKNDTGGVILMSSLAGLIGMQLVSTYAATKAFAWNLAEALHYELKPQNIDIMSCVAGATKTPAYLKTTPTYGFFKPLVMQPKKVAVSSLKQLGRRAFFIPGFSNRMNYFILTRLLPRKTAAYLANKTMLQMFAHKNN